MLSITQLTEIIEEKRDNVVSIATGRPIISVAAGVEPELLSVRSKCVICGRWFWWARQVGAPGRNRRTCSDACWKIRHRHLLQSHRAKVRAAGTGDLLTWLDQVGGGSNLSNPSVS